MKMPTTRTTTTTKQSLEPVELRSRLKIEVLSSLELISSNVFGYEIFNRTKSYFFVLKRSESFPLLSSRGERTRQTVSLSINFDKSINLIFIEFIDKLAVDKSINFDKFKILNIQYYACFRVIYGIIAGPGPFTVF
jgi:hypothetical protein